MDKKKQLILRTLYVLLGIFCLVVAVEFFTTPKTMTGKPPGFLTLGRVSAPIQIVLIEDLTCKNCIEFTQSVLPNIRSEYVDKGVATFTLVPVSYLSDSYRVANAVLEVHKQRPDLFVSYLYQVLEIQDLEHVKTSELVQVAKRMGGVDLMRLKRCIDDQCHAQELKKNLDWARMIMGSKFRTPAIYINGDMGSTFSFKAIQYQINQLLGNRI